MIGFVGLSHLGLNYSLATAAKGFEVLAFDPAPALVEKLRAGIFPIEEPGFAELFQQHRGRLHYTSDLADLGRCELIFYSLDVRTNDRNESDLAPLTALIDATAPSLAAGATAVVLSQVKPGYTRALAERLAARADVRLGALHYQVETLIFGAAVQRALQPERYMVGAAEPAQPLPAAYRQWLDAFSCPVLVMRYESAELAKIAINFFLVSTVSTTNTLAEVCEAIGADWGEIAPALRLDRRIGPHAYLQPGLGLAGGNLERDLVTVQGLAAAHGTEAGLVAAWQRNSAWRRDWVLREVHRLLLAQAADPLIALWGLAYKADTHSTKNSAALELLRSLGPRRISGHDPVAQIDPWEFPGLTLHPDPVAGTAGADALLVMTPWRLYAGLPPAEVAARMRGRLVLDPWGGLDGAAWRAAGFTYRRLGC
jgi:UDPglucose 6-dehydrogenase